jgi:hypothetical protein
LAIGNDSTDQVCNNDEQCEPILSNDNSSNNCDDIINNWQRQILLSADLAKYIHVDDGTCMQLLQFVNSVYIELVHRKLTYISDKRVFRVDSETSSLFNIPMSVNESTKWTDPDGFNFNNFKFLIINATKQYLLPDDNEKTVDPDNNEKIVDPDEEPVSIQAYESPFKGEPKWSENPATFRRIKIVPFEPEPIETPINTTQADDQPVIDENKDVISESIKNVQVSNVLSKKTFSQKLKSFYTNNKKIINTVTVALTSLIIAISMRKK